MPRNPIGARSIIRIPLLEAGARGEVEDPDAISDLLADAIKEIESAAREQLDALRLQLDELRKAHEAERALWQAERVVLARLRRRAERDAAGLTGSRQMGPLEDPHGFYIYFLWSHTGQILYVGMSTNVLGRLGEHVRNWRHAIYRITTVTCPDEETMRRMETRAIAEHLPPWNTVGIPA